MRGNRSSNSGQVLLLLIMVLGTLLIVGMTAIFQTSTQTQIGGINQQSQLTITAAEAALEKALLEGRSGSFADLGLSNLGGINVDNSFVEISEFPVKQFSTKRLNKDEQYMFYLSQYTPEFPYFDRQYLIGFQVLYDSPTGTCEDVSLVMTLVYDKDSDYIYEAETFISDAGDKIYRGTTNRDIFKCVISDDPTCVEGEGGGNIDGYEYACATKIIDTGEYESAKFILVQNYFGPTRIGFKTDGTSQFPPQGRTIKAIARAALAVTPGAGTPVPTAQAGLTRVAEIFQSYPQFPADFWVTSF
ncbi:MAG: hypothetical protein N2691_05825 [Patescibacteria group bacterium]|nr:hypothetical protein [Patescibacteria group bacterium]